MFSHATREEGYLCYNPMKPARDDRRQQNGGIDSEVDLTNRIASIPLKIGS